MSQPRSLGNGRRHQARFDAVFGLLVIVAVIGGVFVCGLIGAARSGR